MSEIPTVNSSVYWDNRFSDDWETCDGPRQSRFFTKLAIENLPSWLIEQIRRQSLTLADWGCAQGDGTDMWASYLPENLLTGIDFSAVAIEQASKRYPAIKFINENWLAPAPAKINSFDIVFSSNTLEHFYKPYEALEALSSRADKAIILALPYCEFDRISEHFYTFLANNIPIILSNGFRLVWSRIIDCSDIPKTQWPGYQIFLVYAENSWIESLKLTLKDCKIEQHDIASTFNHLNQVVAERDEQITNLNQVVAERDEQITNLNQAVTDRDKWLEQYSQQITALKRSHSWRITSPLRTIGTVLRKVRTVQRTFSELGAVSTHEDYPLWRKRLSYLITRYKNGVQRYGLLRSLPLAMRASYRLGSAWMERQLRQRTYKRRLRELRTIIIEHGGFIDLFHVPMGWRTPLFQRFQHMSLQAAQLGGLALYGGHLQVDKDLFVFSQVEGKVIVFDALDDRVVQCVFDALLEVRQLKVLRLQSIDLTTKISDLERFIRDGLIIVYEYIDEISEEITGTIPTFVIERHKWLLKNEAVFVVATSDRLFAEVNRHRTSQYILSTNGVDLLHWRKTVSHPLADMEPALASGRTVVGYHGALANWIDYDLLKKIADDGRYELVLIGYAHDDSLEQSGILNIPSVHFLGSKSYFVLNEYAAFYDIGILPFKRNKLTESVSPVKLFEYMAASKPVVTTYLPECVKYKSCLVSDTHDNFLNNLIIAAAAKNDPAYMAALADDAEKNSWTKKATLVYQFVGIQTAKS